jgi:hypothetical protein
MRKAGNLPEDGYEIVAGLARGHALMLCSAIQRVGVNEPSFVIKIRKRLTRDFGASRCNESLQGATISSSTAGEVIQLN